MTQFEETLTKFNNEAAELQKQEIELQAKARMFQERFIGFLKENGVPENHTTPGLLLLAIRKSRT